MKTIIIINNEEHFLATKSASNQASFHIIRNEKQADFKTYCDPATFRDLAAETILNQNNN